MAKTSVTGASFVKYWRDEVVPWKLKMYGREEVCLVWHDLCGPWRDKAAQAEIKKISDEVGIEMVATPAKVHDMNIAEYVWASMDRIFSGEYRIACLQQVKELIPQVYARSTTKIKYIGYLKRQLDCINLTIKHSGNNEYHE